MSECDDREKGGKKASGEVGNEKLLLDFSSYSWTIAKSAGHEDHTYYHLLMAHPFCQPLGKGKI